MLAIIIKIRIILSNWAKFPPSILLNRYIIIIIIIIKKDWQCKAGRGRLTPYQSEDPSSPHYQPIEQKNRNGK